MKNWACDSFFMPPWKEDEKIHQRNVPQEVRERNKMKYMPSKMEVKQLNREIKRKTQLECGRKLSEKLIEVKT